MKSRLAYIGVAFILSFGLFPALTFANTNLSGTINSDRTLTLAESPYVIYTPVTVAEGVTVNVEPGVILKFWQNGAIWVYGGLNVNGTGESSVYLTSLDDDSIGGDTGGDGNTGAPTPWHGIIFYQNSTGDISHADIRYGGTYNQNSGWASIANLGILSISDSVFTNAPASYAFRQMVGTSTITRTEFGVGVRQAVGIEGGVSDITFCRIHDSIERGLWVKNSTVHLADSILESIAGDALSVYFSATFTHENNQFLNNYRNGISMWGTLNADAVLSDDNGMPYFIDKITVPAGKTLTVNPGATIKFYDRGNVFIEGVMNVLGTKENPVRITSWNDDATIGDSNGDGNATLPSARDWQSLTVLAGGQLTMTHADVAYGGGQGYFYANWPSVGNEGGTINIDSVTFHDNTVGVNNDAGQSTIRNSSFKNNNIGAYLAYGSLSVQNSSFVGNGQGVGTYYNSADVADAINNWWGDASGPSHYTNNPSGTGDGVADRVNFTPWLTSEPGIVTSPADTCCSSVLFLPGLEASRLYKQKTILGLSVEDQLWEPNAPSDVNDLYLNSDGSSIVQNIYTRDAIDSTNSFGAISRSNIYKDLILKLNNLVAANSIRDWKPYAYDWRQGIDDLIQNGTAYENGQVISLIDTLESLADTSKNGKVTIIAHSNGGLLAKALIKKLEEEKFAGQSDLIDKIDNLILVASPQVGTPSAISSVLHGYGQSLPFGIMSEGQARKLAVNMPSAYGLLPSQKYFEQAGISVLGVFSTSSPQLYKTAYGSGIDTYQEEHNFVLGEEGRTQPSDSNLIEPIKGNATLLSQAEALHGEIDNFSYPQSLNVVSIAGWGKSTVAGITYTNSDIEPIFTFRGDQTVVMPSALYGQGTKYWLDLSNSKLKHANILEDTQILDFLSNIIEQKSAASVGVTNTEPIQVGDRLHLSVHSPVSIGVYDDLNNFTGKVCDTQTSECSVQENIPGSSYFEFGEGKYVSLSKENLQKVTLLGTDTGTFTFNSETDASTGDVTTSSFIDVPVTTQTQAEVTFNEANGLPVLKLDVTGDGVNDFTLSPSSNFDPISYLQIMKKTVDSLDIPQSKIRAFDKRIDDIIKLIQKGKIEKAKLKADKFKSAIERKNFRHEEKHKRAKKLSKEDAQLLLDMLNNLLDNLN